MSLGEEGAATVRVAKRATARGRNFIFAVEELLKEKRFVLGLINVSELRGTDVRKQEPCSFILESSRSTPRHSNLHNQRDSPIKRS